MVLEGDSKLRQQKPSTTSSSSSNISLISTISISSLTEIEASLRGVHAQQRSVLRDLKILESRLRSQITSDNLAWNQQECKTKELAASSLLELEQLWQSFNIQAADVSSNIAIISKQI